MRYKLVCVTDKRTIVTSSDIKEIERRYEVHTRRTGHNLEVYPIDDTIKITGKKLLASVDHNPINITVDEEE